MWAISQENPATEITHFERMGLNGLSSNSLILTRGKAFKGREGKSLSVHAYTLACSLFFFLILFPFLSFPLYFALSCFVVLCGIVMLSPSFFFLLFLLSVHDEGLFYIACHDWVFTILPLNCFCLGVGVLPRSPIGLSTTHPLPLICAGYATSHS